MNIADFMALVTTHLSIGYLSRVAVRLLILESGHPYSTYTRQSIKFEASVAGPVAAAIHTRTTVWLLSLTVLVNLAVSLYRSSALMRRSKIFHAEDLITLRHET